MNVAQCVNDLFEVTSLLAKILERQYQVGSTTGISAHDLTDIRDRLNALRKKLDEPGLTIENKAASIIMR